MLEAGVEVEKAARGSANVLSAPRTDPWACGDNDVPPLFLSGCVGNVTQARAKWERAREWRRRFDIDQILGHPHVQFATIYDCCMDCFLPNSRNGDAVYLSQPGQMMPRGLATNNIMPEDVVHHLVFLVEFALADLRADPNKNLQIVVYDLKGASISHLNIWNIRCIRALTQKWQQSYCGHERAVLVINAPAIFPLIWSIVGPLLNQTKRRNIHIASQGRDTYDLLARFLDHKDIPGEYGGGLVLPRGLKADRHLIPPQARLMQLIESLQRAHPDCKEHMPVM